MVGHQVRIFYSDIHELTIQTKYQTPPLRPVHPKEIVMTFSVSVYSSESGCAI